MIRRGLVTIVLLGLTLALVTSVIWRAVLLQTTLVTDLDPDEPEATTEERSETPTGPVLHVPAPPPEHPPIVRVLDRPLSVVGLGWDRLAPALLANAGKVPNKASVFSPSGLAVSVEPTDDLSRVVEALARGGALAGGADVAVVPLPRWLTVQDELQAIDPVVFYVAGWSQGREAVFAGSLAEAGVPDAGSQVRLGVGNMDAAYLALFGLDAMGISPRMVTFADPAAEPAPVWQAVDVLSVKAATSAGVRPAMQWTTAQASGLIPIVMVASRPWARAHTAALVTWLRGWWSGVTEGSGKIAEAARRLGEMEGAPEPLRLMRGMETWEPCSLKQNLELFELDTARGLPLRTVMMRTWGLLHEAQVAGPSPTEMPLHAGVIEAAVRARVPTDVDATSWRGSSASPTVAGAGRVVLTRPLDEVDGYELARHVAELGSVFPTAQLRVTPKKKDGPIQHAFELARALSPIPQAVELNAPRSELATAGTLEVLLRP